MRYLLEIKEDKVWKSYIFQNHLDLIEVKNIASSKTDKTQFKLLDTINSKTQTLTKKQILGL